LYRDYNTDKKNCKIEVLEDVSKTGKSRPWVEKRLNTEELAKSYERLGNKKYFRIKDCGTFLEFRRYIETKELKLNRSNFCKVRLCPMCSWRRSLKIFGQVSQVMNKALDNEEYRFLFLTLTCKNVYGEDLSSQIDDLFYAFNKMTKRKIFKDSIKGWFRGLEVTHNLTDDTYHPHFHIILTVNKNYFINPREYISHENWVKLWKSCLKIDYNPIVNIKAFKTGNKKQVEKSIAETAKYTVKDNDFIIKDEKGEVNEKMTDDAVFILDKALANRRLVAFGGLLRDIQKKLNLDDMENGDLVNTDNEVLREDLDYILERYKWNIGYSQYTKIQ